MSPVWRAKLQGGFGGTRQLELEADDAAAFPRALALSCGETVVLDGGLEELLALGRFADKYQVPSHIRFACGIVRLLP